MTATNLGDDTTTITAEGTDLVIERVYDVPRERVWTALTSADCVAHWWGRTGTTTDVVELDVRPGGKWRYIAQTHDGGGAPFAGEHTEVVAPARIVRTFIFDVPPFNSGPPAVETVTLDDLDGKTRFRSSTRFPSEEILQGAIADDMAKGTLEEYDRLAQLLAGMA